MRCFEGDLISLTIASSKRLPGLVNVALIVSSGSAPLMNSVLPSILATPLPSNERDSTCIFSGSEMFTFDGLFLGPPYRTVRLRIGS
jgi:hypothetical protein